MIQLPPQEPRRPLIGDKAPPSPLGDIQPDRWLLEYTSDLNVLALLVELEPKQAGLLRRICDGPLTPARKLNGLAVMPQTGAVCSIGSIAASDGYLVPIPEQNGI